MEKNLTTLEIGTTANKIITKEEFIHVNTISEIFIPDYEAISTHKYEHDHPIKEARITPMMMEEANQKIVNGECLNVIYDKLNRVTKICFNRKDRYGKAEVTWNFVYGTELRVSNLSHRR